MIRRGACGPVGLHIEDGSWQSVPSKRKGRKCRRPAPPPIGRKHQREMGRGNSEQTDSQISRSGQTLIREPNDESDLRDRAMRQGGLSQPLAVHPTFGIDSCQPVLGCGDSPKILAHMLLSNVPNRNVNSVYVADRDSKEALCQKNAFGVMA